MDDATQPARFYRLLTVPNLVALTATATNTTTQIGASDILQITLDANASTGFIWDFVADTNSVVRLAGEPQYLAGAGVGAGGKMVFQFEPVGPGQSPLKLIYHRRFDPSTTPPEKTFEMTVVVQP